MAEDDIQDIDDADVPSTEIVDQAKKEQEEKAAPRRATYYVVGAIVLILIVLLALVFILRRRTASTEEEKKEDVVVSVRVAKAERDSIAKEISAIGNVVPATRADVAASISAQIQQMGQLKNKLVHAGDPIAVLSSQDLVAQRNQAQASLDEARLNLQTVQKVQIPQATAQSTKEVF